MNVRICAGISIFIAVFAISAAVAEVPQPYQLVRALEILQDDVANGSLDARASQRGMLEQIGNQFLTVDHDRWAEPRNIHAAVLYILNGGSTAIVRKVIDPKALSDEDRNLITGALAYVTGREPEARKRFSSVDPLKLGPVLGGNVALVIGSLVIRDDSPKAIRMMQLARLLLPGTLIEESALRRETFVHFESQDIESFSRVGAEYLRRFGRSAYADQFRQRLDLAIRKIARSADPSAIEKLDPLFEETGGNYNESLLLLLAREALSYGRIPIARSATKKAQSLKSLDRQLLARVDLYSQIVDLFTPNLFAARLSLDSFSQGEASEEDKLLLVAGQSIAGRLTLWPPEASPGKDEALPMDGVRADAIAALARSNDLLVRTDR